MTSPLSNHNAASPLFVIPKEALLNIISFVEFKTPWSYVRLTELCKDFRLLKQSPLFWELIATKIQFPLLKNPDYQQFLDDAKSLSLSNQIKDFWPFWNCLDKIEIYKKENKHDFLAQNGKTLLSFFSEIKDFVIYKDEKKFAECAQLFRFINQPFNDLSFRALTDFYGIDFTQFKSPNEAQDSLKDFLDTFRLLFKIAPQSQYQQIMQSYAGQITSYQQCEVLDAFAYFVGLEFTPAEFRQWCHNRTVKIPAAITIEIHQLPDEIFANIKTFNRPSCLAAAVGLPGASLTLSNEEINVIVQDQNGDKFVEFYFIEDTQITHREQSPP